VSLAEILAGRLLNIDTHRHSHHCTALCCCLQERQKLESDKAKAGDPAAAAAKGAGMLPRGVAKEQQQQVQFQSPQGRAVYDALFKPPLVNRALIREMFQPRRTAFVFEFGEGAGDMPTTLRRSKADCLQVQVRVVWLSRSRMSPSSVWYCSDGLQ
jgi:hypothetical protein